MRRFIAGVAFGAGALFAFRWRLLRRRRRPEPPAGDPAEDLKRKLEERRAAEPEAEPEPPAVPAPAEPDLEQRRRDVHTRGRAAIDRMRPDADADNASANPDMKDG